MALQQAATTGAAAAGAAARAPLRHHAHALQHARGFLGGLAAEVPSKVYTERRLMG